MVSPLASLPQEGSTLKNTLQKKRNSVDNKIVVLDETCMMFDHNPDLDFPSVKSH